MTDTTATPATETALELCLRRAQDATASTAIRVAFAAAHRILLVEELAADGTDELTVPDKVAQAIATIEREAVSAIIVLEDLSTPNAAGIVRDAILQGRARRDEQARRAARAAHRAELAARAERLGRRLCGRCEGTGAWPGNGGTCYGCGGDGLDPHYFVDEG